jgi:ribosomal protein L16 Arg81 hydroxylase
MNNVNKTSKSACDICENDHNETHTNTEVFMNNVNNTKNPACDYTQNDHNETPANSDDFMKKDHNEIYNAIENFKNSFLKHIREVNDENDFYALHRYIRSQLDAINSRLDSELLCTQLKRYKVIDHFIPYDEYMLKMQGPIPYLTFDLPE